LIRFASLLRGLSGEAIALSYEKPTLDSIAKGCLFMPVREVQGTSLKYYLVTFDADGNERDEPGGGKLSQEILNILSSEAITDVFIFCHGWMADVPRAEKQYDKWVKAMAEAPVMERIQQRQPKFCPLLIGLHWPSLPWGNEKLEQAIIDPNSSTSNLPKLIEQNYSECIANTPRAMDALRRIGETVMKENNYSFELPKPLEEAYTQLDEETGLSTEGVGAKPGRDRNSFDPQRVHQAYKGENGYGKDFPDDSRFTLQRIRDALLAPARALSFYSMKRRALTFGERGGSQFLQELQKKAPKEARFHLMGHSFGCIVVSAMLASPESGSELVYPVHSLSLVQGALSLWSYCAKIPEFHNVLVNIKKVGKPGYFHTLIADGRVAGPIITTHSDNDTAVSDWYPLSAFMGQQLDYAPGDLPAYGGIGYWGIQGSELNPEAMKILPCDATYQLEQGKIYNLDSTDVIRRKTELFRLQLPSLGEWVFHDRGGAHNEISEPEIAHAVWSAAFWRELGSK
jgi:hypothetical protein